jgi:hypothetical protein
MKKKLSIFMFIILAVSAAAFFIGFNGSNAYAAVGNTYKQMQKRYRMKRIPLSALYFYQNELEQYNYKNSGIKAYEYTFNKVKYEAVFNTGGVCWLEFAVSNNSTVIPLSQLIQKNLYGYPILFRTLRYVPNEYEKLQYGRDVGKVIYIMQYIYQDNDILQEAVMPSMSPDGDY